MRWREALGLAAVVASLVSACLSVTVNAPAPPAPLAAPPRASTREATARPRATPRTTFWTDSFENHLWVGSNDNPWDQGECVPPTGATFYDGCNAQISTTFAHTGSHSLWSHYDGGPTGCGTGPFQPSPSQDGCGTFYDRSHALSTSVWWTWYLYHNNFVYDGSGNPAGQQPLKVFIMMGNGFKWYFNFDAAGHLTIQPDTSGDSSDPVNTPPENQPVCGSTACIYTANLANPVFNNNHWYCIEAHYQGGTPGQTNSVMQMWIDGQQTFNYSNVFTYDTHARPNGFGWVRHYTQFGVGDRYIDDLTVSDTRINCTGGGGPTAPNAPSAPTLSQMMHRTWAALVR